MSLHSCSGAVPLQDEVRQSDYIVIPFHLKASLLKELSSKSRLVNWVMALSRASRAESSKIPSRIDTFVTESVRKSLSQAIKPHERPSALATGSGPHRLVNLNFPAFVLDPSWTMSWLQGWAAAPREVEREKRGHGEGEQTEWGRTDRHVTACMDKAKQRYSYILKKGFDHQQKTWLTNHTNMWRFASTPL